MKKNMIILLILLLWASPAAAQEVTELEAPVTEAQTGEAPDEFDVKIKLGYQDVSLDNSNRAGEYEYLDSSAGGALDLEWIPLPHRFAVSSYYLNKKDYFAELDYAFSDMVLLNAYTRGMYHNLDHYRFGSDDTTTLSPSFIDLNPDDQYAVKNQLNRVFLRFKTKDFPFHLYADATTVHRDGLVQQRFMRGYTGGLEKVSRSRDIDWSTQEVRLGINSHAGPVEVDYSHLEKKFTAAGDKVLYDSYPLMTVPHNLVPDLKSSSDTIKIHTSYTGKLVASATYADGSNKNADSDTRADFRNAAGDLTLMPVTRMLLVLKYRHYDFSVSNPDTVTLSGLGSTYAVRDSISSKRDVLTGIIRYRLTSRLTAKGRYTVDTIERDVWHGNSLSPLQISPPQGGTGPNDWKVANRTLKGTTKLGVFYRIMSRLSVRADGSIMQISNPAYANDPDRVNAAKATATWTPMQWVIALASYGGVREKRDNLSAPLAGGSRKTDRDQALGSVTVLVGKRTSITASYLYFKDKTSETITITDATGMFNLEEGVPYGDKAEVFSLSAGQAVSKRVMLTADVSRSYSNGNFRISGIVPGTTGIDILSDLRVIEDIYSADMEIQHSKRVNSELRYQQRHYDDKIDNTQDGRVDTILATVSAKW